MRTLRVWLLLLLVVLLPVRGAVAAAMLCPVGGTGMQSETAGPEAREHGHHHADAHGHRGTPADDGHAGHDHAASDKCNLCSASCSLTPLVRSIPTLAEPLEAAVKFADLSAPRPDFFSDGQERPPRTL